jgi:hypothetical protein
MVLLERTGTIFLALAVVNVVSMDTAVVTDSTSSLTGALRSAGGLGIKLSSYFGGAANFENNIDCDGDVAITGTTTITGTMTANGNLDFTATTASTTSTTGALKTAGGLGVQLNANIGGNLGVKGDVAITGDTVQTKTTQSTANTNGALITAGGLGVVKNTYIGGVLGVAGDVVLTATTASTSSITGALKTAGGLGVQLNLHVGGDTTIVGTMAATTVSETSDRRFKKDIETLSNALETVTKMRGVKWNWNSKNAKGKKFPKGMQTGFIAQEIEEIVSSAVRTDAEGWKSIAYTQLIPFVVEAVKELQVHQTATDKLVAKQAEELKVMRAQLALLLLPTANLRGDGDADSQRF